MTDILKTLPSDFQKDLQTAIKILQDSGCTEIYIFGSVAHGEFRCDSDIDLAVRGCPKGTFFSSYGQLIRYLDHSVDLVDLDKQISFSRFLQAHGELIRVA